MSIWKHPVFNIGEAVSYAHGDFYVYNLGRYMMFRMQWKLMLHKKAVWFAFLISLVYAVVAFIYEKRNPMVTNVSGFWHYCGMGDSFEWSIFTMILSFLVAIPAMSFQWDVSDKTLASVCVRDGWKAYLQAKMKAVFWIEFVIVVIPFALNLILCLLFFEPIYSCVPSPYGGTIGELEQLADRSSWTMGTAVPFLSLFKKFPILYVFFYMIFLGLFVGFLGVVLLALSFWFRRFKILLFVPVFALMKFGQKLDIWSYYVYHMKEGHRYINFNFWDYVSPISYCGKVYSVFFVCILIFAGFVYWSYRMISRKEFTDV